MIFHVFLFLISVAACCYASNQVWVPEAIIAFIVAAANLIAMFMALYNGGKPLW